MRTPGASSIVISSIERRDSSIAARALSASAAVVTSSFAPASMSWCASSWLVFAGFAGVTIAPSRATAWNTTANSGEFGDAERDDVALADAELREARGHASHLLEKLAIGEGAARDAVDERRIIAPPAPPRRAPRP